LRSFLFRGRRLLSFRHRKAWTKRWTLLARLAQRSSTSVCLFNEVVDSEYWPQSPGARSDRKHHLRLTAEIYQRLKRNYDAKGDYWAAEHWHFGEMEMQRLHSRWKAWPLRWWSQHFKLVALYKYSSAYGGSYARPLCWLVIVISAFALLYPIVGTGLLLNAPESPCHSACFLNYWNYRTFFAFHPEEHPGGVWGVLLHSVMTSLSVAGFQRELRYTPGYPWGRMLALVELLLTTTLAGLFALAVRRKF
jgi:hypothetical protein